MICIINVVFPVGFATFRIEYPFFDKVMVPSIPLFFYSAVFSFPLSARARPLS